MSFFTGAFALPPRVKGPAPCALAYAFFLGRTFAGKHGAKPLHPEKDLVAHGLDIVSHHFELNVFVREAVIAEFKRGYALAYWNRRKPAARR